MLPENEPVEVNETLTGAVDAGVTQKGEPVMVLVVIVFPAIDNKGNVKLKSTIKKNSPGFLPAERVFLLCVVKKGVNFIVMLFN